MKLKEVKMYQAVVFRGSTHNHFSTAKIDIGRQGPISIELKDSIVVIEHEGFKILIPLTNIAYAIPEEEEVVVSTKLKKI